MWPTGCGLLTTVVFHNSSTRPWILREQEVLGWEHLGKETRSLFPWQSDSGGQVKWCWGGWASQGHGFFSDDAFILVALNLPGILALNSSERQTLDLSGLENFAVRDTGGQQASSEKLSSVGKGGHVSCGMRQR